jgi:hypothetical protein
MFETFVCTLVFRFFSDLGFNNKNAQLTSKEYIVRRNPNFNPNLPRMISDPTATTPDGWDEVMLIDCV